MPFCPSCNTEFRAGVDTCSECKTGLEDSPREHGESDQTFGDLFHCHDALVARRVVDLLGVRDIEALLRDRSCDDFPTNSGISSGQFIAVSEADKKGAREIIETALSDEVLLGSDGEFV